MLISGYYIIEIIFKENGVDGLEVIDNGSGVDRLNYETIGKIVYI